MNDWIEALDAMCRKYSLRKVADEIGYSPSVVSEVKNGKYKPDSSNVKVAFLSVYDPETAAIPGLMARPKNHHARRQTSDPNTKRCRRCMDEKPLSDFHAQSHRPDGRYSNCKECRNSQIRKRRKSNGYGERTRYIEDLQAIIRDGMRPCVTCEEVKPLSEFHSSPSKPGDVSSECKSCACSRASDWYDENHNRAIHRKRQYYQENRLEILRKQRERYRSDEDYRKSSRRRAREWAQQNPRRVRARTSRRRAVEHDASGEHTGSDIIRLWHRQNGRCFWCGDRTSTSPDEDEHYHIDHIIPLSKGGTDWPRNLCISCPSCNLRKQARWPIEWVYERRMLDLDTWNV